MSRDAARPMPVYTPEQFGKHHDRLLYYLESVAVDHRGYPDIRSLSCNPARHPDRTAPGQIWKDKYTTELKDGPAETGHDDWDCVEDLVASGLLLWREQGKQPRFELTEKGWAYAAWLRRSRGERALRK